MILRKDQLELSLHEEKRLIENGRLKEDSPLDTSENFDRLCEACRRGDLKECQLAITEGANINARDQFNYTPLILASLCGHYEVVQLLLESGALCERDTFQGERCLYNALTDRIRNLLLAYDYSKSTDPLQPLASHITSLLTKEQPQTSDIVVTSANQSFKLHKLLLSARSPYFRTKLTNTPDITSYKLSPTIPPQAFGIAIRYLYLGEIPNDVGGGPGTGFSEEEVLEGIDKLSRQLEIRSLWEGILGSGDRRIARQNRTDEVEKGRNQFEAWFLDNVVKHKVIVNSARASDVKWDRENSIFADVLLRADDQSNEAETYDSHGERLTSTTTGIPVGPSSQSHHTPFQTQKPQLSTLFPAHRAMLIRSEYFQTMFSSSFIEAQTTPHLQIIHLDCSPEVLSVILTYIYTEKSNIPLSIAVEVLFAADLLLIEKLKVKAALVISTLGNGPIAPNPSQAVNPLTPSQTEPEEIDIYDVIRAGWLTRVPRLETFAALYFAQRLEHYIDEEEFAELLQESAERIQKRQETDSIELLDDIRYYLSERFRLRFEDSGIDDMMDEEKATAAPADAETAHICSKSENTNDDEGIDLAQDSVGLLNQENVNANVSAQIQSGAVRTLDGEIVGDEFIGDAVNYQILLGKIDALLERLKLDA